MAVYDRRTDRPPTRARRRPCGSRSRDATSRSPTSLREHVEKRFREDRQAGLRAGPAGGRALRGAQPGDRRRARSPRRRSTSRASRCARATPRADLDHSINLVRRGARAARSSATATSAASAASARRRSAPQTALAGGGASRRVARRSEASHEGCPTGPAAAATLGRMSLLDRALRMGEAKKFKPTRSASRASTRSSPSSSSSTDDELREQADALRERAAQDGESLDDLLLRVLRARARGRPAHDGHAPLRRPADRRHGAARRRDRRDEDRRGQDADRRRCRSSSTRSPARASTSSPSTTTSPAATPSG